ncbi:hypothetical protein BCR33DRAFT_716692 [Rhizoclosmatium globosum]|uniref:Uncharacterized protein n=1 Tax=Rhizoclosmatium globosum TaxID=329046 RepID=A0A1Y2CD27_9FUNG|nr:hypothetical protein BCR33DRAFT_716692 [Rhizoclosmatium globosum]|eukprot:ORY44724.1 hypothetical protein BCR33DRAFT_716692 [Rhizoclosmatium globosum]
MSNAIPITDLEEGEVKDAFSNRDGNMFQAKGPNRWDGVDVGGWKRPDSVGRSRFEGSQGRGFGEEFVGGGGGRGGRGGRGPKGGQQQRGFGSGANMDPIKVRAAYARKETEEVVRRDSPQRTERSPVRVEVSEGPVSGMVNPERMRLLGITEDQDGGRNGHTIRRSPSPRQDRPVRRSPSPPPRRDESHSRTELEPPIHPSRLQLRGDEFSPRPRPASPSRTERLPDRSSRDSEPYQRTRSPVFDREAKRSRRNDTFERPQRVGGDDERQIRTRREEIQPDHTRAEVRPGEDATYGWKRHGGDRSPEWSKRMDGERPPVDRYGSSKRNGYKRDDLRDGYRSSGRDGDRREMERDSGRRDDRQRDAYPPRREDLRREEIPIRRDDTRVRDDVGSGYRRARSPPPPPEAVTVGERERLNAGGGRYSRRRSPSPVSQAGRYSSSRREFEGRH